MFGRGQEVRLLSMLDPGLVENNDDQNDFPEKEVCCHDVTVTLQRDDGKETSAEISFCCREDPETVEDCPQEEGREDAD